MSRLKGSNSSPKGKKQDTSKVITKTAALWFTSSSEILWQSDLLWSENKLQKLKAVKFIWIMLLTFVLWKHFCNQNHFQTMKLIRVPKPFNTEKRVRDFCSMWRCHCSGYASPPFSRQCGQTFLPLTRAVDVTELVAAGSEETFQEPQPSADPVSKRNEGYPWRNRGAAPIQGATRQDRQHSLGQDCHHLRWYKEDGGTVKKAWTK